MKKVIYLLTTLLLVSLSVHADEQAIQEEQVSDQLSQFKTELEDKIKEKEAQSQDAHERSERTKSTLEKSLADYLSKLQSYQSSILEIKLTRVNELEGALNIMRQKSSLLRDLESKTKQKKAVVTIEDLENASSIWRQIVDETLSQLFEADLIEIETSVVPPDGIDRYPEKYPELRAEISKTLIAIEKELIEVRSAFVNLRDTEREVRSGLLLNSGRVRSQLMNHLIKKGEYSAWSFFKNPPQDYLREVQVVPYRFIATFTQKYYEYISLSREGPRGWLSIFKQSLLLGFVLILPFLIFSLFKKISHFLSETRKNLFTYSKLNYRSRTRLAVWIGRLNPYLPWVFAYLTITMASKSLSGTILDPLLVLLPYFSIYVGFRIFQLLLSTLLANVLLSKNLDLLRNSQKAVKSTAYRFSLILFIELAILHITRDAVRRALIYNIIFDFIVVFNILLVCFESRKWKNELQDLASRWFSEKWLSHIKNIKWTSLELVLYPLLFILNALYIIMDSLTEWMSQFEFGKKLLSELFRKRLEEAVEESGEVKKSLPDSYKSYFLNQDVDNEIRVSLSRSPLKSCLEKITSWKNGDSQDDLLLIYGNYGIGKSALLSSLQQNTNDSFSVRCLSIKSRVTSTDKFMRLLSESLGSEINSSKDLEDWDKSADKTLIFIDDIQMLYLNDVDGLSAYRTLINLTSMQLENIFWCFACDERAWAHLTGIFGPNHLAGVSVELLSWSDSEIQNLITKRHQKSELKIKFDSVIGAVHRGDILESSSGLEVQFFRMLWGQSRGNPKAAQELWLTATYMRRQGEVRVTVPEFTSAKELSEFNDQALLLFATIARHERLSHDELLRIAYVSESTVRQALKQGEDGDILQRMPDGYWRIHPKAQYVVYSQLAGRNLIYG